MNEPAHSCETLGEAAARLLARLEQRKYEARNGTDQKHQARVLDGRKGGVSVATGEAAFYWHMELRGRRGPRRIVPAANENADFAGR